MISCFIQNMYMEQKVYRGKYREKKQDSNGRSRPKHPLKLFSFHVVLFCERTSRKGSDLNNQVRSWELVKESSHIVATYTLSVGTLPPYLTTLNTQKTSQFTKN